MGREMSGRNPVERASPGAAESGPAAAPQQLGAPTHGGMSPVLPSLFKDERMKNKIKVEETYVWGFPPYIRIDDGEGLAQLFLDLPGQQRRYLYCYDHEQEKECKVKDGDFLAAAARAVIRILREAGQRRNFWMLIELNDVPLSDFERVFLVEYLGGEEW
jgi:hypothetical protein